MLTEASQLAKSGLEVVDIIHDEAFRARKLRAHPATIQMTGLRRIARAFVHDPEHIFQDLVASAIDLCGADSAGISVVREDGTDAEFYRWVATAGIYRGFQNAMLPKYPSACGVCLERNRPQHFRVTERFFQILGVEARPVTDGLLLPWRAGSTAGTIFVMAHERAEAFDVEDLAVMEMLADFAAMGVGQMEQRKLLLERATTTASARMAHELAHEINNPLQSIINLLYLAMRRNDGDPARTLAAVLENDVTRLSSIVRKLLTLPKQQLDALEADVNASKNSE